MKILIINDDSIDSPFLELLMKILPREHEYTIVVPAEEQSWKGKSMTRFQKLKVGNEPLGDYEAITVAGTPADCANIGIYNVLGGQVDAVVSGINIGHNTGLAYIFSSGTVGAALEGNIAGVPGLALSQLLPPNLFNEWIETRKFSSESLEFIQAQLEEVFPEIWKRFEKIIQAKKAITWNVNFPGVLADKWELRSTRCAKNFYKQCFEIEGDYYKHIGADASVQEEDDVDKRAITEGHVSITQLDMNDFGQQHHDL
ncbi:MAG: 5'/3'-nucleotidase SurE [Lentisphaeria bacterium]|nr:5'/3'-nucleotidase SurE [Lentisphaeria bacterium]